MKKLVVNLCFFLFSILTNQTVQASGPDVSTQPLKLGGPRLGVTYLSPGDAYDNAESVFGIEPIVSQFGWQFEKRFFTLSNGNTAVFEFVPLIGGLEQNAFLPSISTVLGYRTGTGMEFGVGPNFSLAGAALVFAAGFNVQTQHVNVPINLAVVPSAGGVRLSVLAGFNMAR